MIDDANSPIAEIQKPTQTGEKPLGDDATKLIKKKGKKKKTNKNGTIGSRRGVETLLRNSYRAHLDLIALAATKANIMISINGLILSFLFISEAFVMSAEPLLELPTGVFLLTCFLSMIFAILSALPDRNQNKWTVNDFMQDRANLLLFEDYADLSEDEYKTAMFNMLQNSPRIYSSMVRQLHSLGLHVNKRMKLLHVAYTVFMIGLGISMLTFFIVLVYISFEGGGANVS
ncbi:MAG: hypothetical protein GY814_05525 [Gammaproteobacteria bacterium]|nr:hypothetical protein [Gammaproteobacteria bacterium]